MRTRQKVYGRHWFRLGSRDVVLFCVLLLATNLGFVWAAGTTGPTLVNENMGGESLNSVAYHNGRFLAGGTGGIVLTSTDGTTWSPLMSGTTDHIMDVVWAGDRFALLTWDGSTANMALLTWTSGGGFVTYPGFLPFGFGQALGWDGTKLIIAWYDGLTDVGRYRTTSDFTTLEFDQLSMGTHCGRVNDIDYVNGTLIMGVRCQFDGFILPAALIHSTDGFTLNSNGITGSADSFGATGIATNGTIAFARADNFTDKFFGHSPDITTTAPTVYTDTATPGFRNLMNDADWIETVFYGVGPAGKIGYSFDGLTWTEVASSHGGFMWRIVPYEGNNYVAVGDDESIIIGTHSSLGTLLGDWGDTQDILDLVFFINNCP